VAGLSVFLAVASYAFSRCVVWKGGFVDALGGD
jgi:hypothetical protein